MMAAKPAAAGAGGAPAAAEAPALPTGIADLTQVIQQSTSSGLNIVPGKAVSNLFAGDHTLTVVSDADNQMILSFPLSATIRLQSLVIGAPGGEGSPTRILLFVNRRVLGFEDIGDVEPTVEILPQASDFAEDGSKDATYRLKPSPKLNGLTSLHLFIEAEGSMQAVLSKVRIIGQAVHTADMSKFDRSNP